MCCERVHWGCRQEQQQNAPEITLASVLYIWGSEENLISWWPVKFAHLLVVVIPDCLAIYLFGHFRLIKISWNIVLIAKFENLLFVRLDDRNGSKLCHSNKPHQTRGQGGVLWFELRFIINLQQSRLDRGPCTLTFNGYQSNCFALQCKVMRMHTLIKYPIVNLLLT